ncbi:MAG: hypothetical protein CVU44_19490 [Chloroflexi bacterium HGW-Chloroflexi-6]|nr:MAG: hypothetical protein CVU44_19490 [Chloroflexi bacterium HGW-Chloroflexi-6]
MNDKFKKYAPLGLVISGLALLAAIGLFLTSALSSARIVTLPDPELITRGLWASAAVVMLGLAVTAFLDAEGVRKFFTGRQARYGSNSAILLLAFLGVLFFINALVFDNPKTWDVTEDQQNTLSPETVAILETLDSPVTARAYFSSQTPTSSVKQLLDNFKSASKDNFNYEFINPEFNPVQAEEDKVERDGTIVLVMGEQREVVSFASERDLASGILRLKNPGERLVYFVTGHGELSIDTPSETAYTLVKQSLEYKNYTVANLNLLSEGQVPENAAALVIAGPQTPFSEAEVAALRAYLDRGGGLIVMKEPPLSAEAIATSDPLDEILTEWGISLSNDFVIDPNVNPASIAVADPSMYASHPITQGLAGFYTAFPTARSLSALTVPENIIITPLAFTGVNAWGETDLESINNNTPAFDEGSDTSGPLTLAIASEDWMKSARLVVFGDSELAADAIYQQGNGDIVVNAIDWVAEQDDQISLTPKESTERLYKQPGTLGLIAMLLGALCVLPLIIAGAGISTWAARRKRG